MSVHELANAYLDERQPHLGLWPDAGILALWPADSVAPPQFLANRR